MSSLWQTNDSGACPGLHMAAVHVGNIPSSLDKEELKAHFSQTKHGGVRIDYVLHPLGLKYDKALVAYEDGSGE